MTGSFKENFFNSSPNTKEIVSESNGTSVNKPDSPRELADFLGLSVESTEAVLEIGRASCRERV